VSLKGFHILLISLSSLLALLFAGWSLHAWRATHRPLHLAFAVFSGLLAAGLLVYVTWFARKVRTRDEEDRERRRHIHPMAWLPAIWLLGVRPAEACAACYGEASGPLIDAARLGVWLLFGLVLALQLAFVVFFFYLRKRAKDFEQRLALRAREMRP
jgi:hypothetical protein